MHSKETSMRHGLTVLSAVVALGSAVIVDPSVAADSAPPKQVTAQELANAPVSATFEFESTQLRLLIGGSSGKGVLRFQGKEYPFTAKSLSVGGVGVAETHAVGEVRYLQNLNDFTGVYTGLTIGATAVKGKGAATFQNTKGVVVSAKSQIGRRGALDGRERLRGRVRQVMIDAARMPPMRQCLHWPCGGP
jgi:hypothetical protein